jgi:hypothetical protein
LVLEEHLINVLLLVSLVIRDDSWDHAQELDRGEA